MFVVNLTLGILCTIFKGFVLAALFNWFVAPELGFAINTGVGIILMILANLATFDPRVVVEKAGNQYERFGETVATAVVFGLAFVLGWLLHLVA
jgi:hypothetical protein